MQPSRCDQRHTGSSVQKTADWAETGVGRVRLLYGVSTITMSKPFRTAIVRRSALAMLLAGGMTMALALANARHRDSRAAESFQSAVERLDSLTHGTPADDPRRAAIAWGYSERLRLGLESPFRLIEASSRDPRLTADERRTVSWALLSRVLRGETHDIDAAALDGLGPWAQGRSAAGEQHLELIESTVATSANPRAAELAVRFAYTLAAAERIIEGAAPMLAAEAAAMIADREVSRREAAGVVRAANGADPIVIVRRRRASRSFYVERPVLLAPATDMERVAIALVRPIVEALRGMTPSETRDSARSLDDNAKRFAPRLFAAGAQVLPTASLTVTVQRYLPLIRTQARRIDSDALARTRNGEMLVGVTRMHQAERLERRAVGRLLLAAGVSMRSVAQEPLWFPGDSAPTPAEVAATFGLADITFDGDVPSAWRPYFTRTFSDGVTDLRRVFPTLRLDGLHVRFRMRSPADSALAMHDPRTRTLHLPVFSAGGTLTHELAHDLDRQSAQQLGLAGYRSDIVARVGVQSVGSTIRSNGKLAASLRALTEELSVMPRAAAARAERPAEIFATRVDWFIASALARDGISSGFLSAVQDELLTGHVVHPHRLRTLGRSRSLLTALEGMTAVAPFALREEDPSAHTLLRWSLAGPVDRQIANDIVRGDPTAWRPRSLIGDISCGENVEGRALLVRMAAESRARGWLRLRARWTPDSARAAWARAALGEAPWSRAQGERRVAELRDYVLLELFSSPELPTGLNAYASDIARRARCGV